MPFLTALILAVFAGYIGAWYTGAVDGNFALLLLLATVVTGLRQDDSRVTLEFGEDTATADYAVGTDGVHSVVRSALGLPFPGRAVLTSIMLADIAPKSSSS